MNKQTKEIAQNFQNSLPENLSKFVLEVTAGVVKVIQIG